MSNEKEYLIENLAMLIAAGIDVVSGLESIKVEIKSKKMRQIIDAMQKDLEGGSSIWQALEKANFFPSYVISLIRVGEETGRLPENLKVIIDQQRKERSFKSKIQSAVMYPALVFGVTLIVGIGIAWFILPKLAIVFSQLKIKLPLITQILIGVGTFLGDWGFLAIPGLILTFSGVFYFLFIRKKTKYIGEQIMFSIPGIQNIIREVEISRFGYLLGTLLSAGIPLADSLTSLISATESKIYQTFYLHIHRKILEGSSFQKSLSTYLNSNILIPAPIQQMIVTSEQSGNLPESFIKIGEIFEERVEISTKNISVLLEPILLVIIWLGVVGVALAVILPIYSLIGGLNQ